LRGNQHWRKEDCFSGGRTVAVSAIFGSALSFLAVAALLSPLSFLPRIAFIANWTCFESAMINYVRAANIGEHPLNRPSDSFIPV